MNPPSPCLPSPLGMSILPPSVISASITSQPSDCSETSFDCQRHPTAHSIGRAGKVSHVDPSRVQPRATPRRASQEPTVEVADVRDIREPDRKPWVQPHPDDDYTLHLMIEETIPYEALALNKASFDEYDVMHNIRKGMLKNMKERAALTAVRRKICGRERSRRNRARDRVQRRVSQDRWRKAQVTMRLLAATKIMKEGGQ